MATIHLMHIKVLKKEKSAIKRHKRCTFYNPLDESRITNLCVSVCECKSIKVMVGTQAKSFSLHLCGVSFFILFTIDLLTEVSTLSNSICIKHDFVSHNFLPFKRTTVNRYQDAFQQCFRNKCIILLVVKRHTNVLLTKCINKLYMSFEACILITHSSLLLFPSVAIFIISKKSIMGEWLQFQYF